MWVKTAGGEPFRGGVGAVWVRTAGGEPFRGGVGAVWVKTAGEEPFRGGMGPMWSKRGVSYRNGADGNPVWVRTAGGEPFRGGLGLCGSNRRATSRFEVEWGPCGRNGAFRTEMGPMQSKLAVSRGLASGVTQIKEVGAHKGALNCYKARRLRGTAGGCFEEVRKA